MNGLDKGIRKAEVALKWDPGPTGQPPADLDLVAATYLAGDPYGEPAHVVRSDSRFPDGAIRLARDSGEGKGFGWDQVMTLELDRLDSRYARVVVDVVIQQRSARRTFGSVPHPALRIREGYTVLAEGDFGDVLESTAATVGEFVRDESGGWNFLPGVHGFEAGTGHRLMPRGHTSPGPENDPDDDWPQES
ncbi:TerD family protein [Streptomyces sp. Go-475]|uniref:TerD family protein n=1 Tax=Streptomyces sp. Go-475 TaxID=2072505 RepID=UPI000DEFFB02|nr:TerD family protein [Streptomyces sp. Go-475]AXE89577.1 Bacterial stress protein [Streptomyces sp. Go-475]